MRNLKNKQTMFELFLNDRGGDGTLAEVWIDKDAKLCKKFYKQNGITIKGKPPAPQVYKNVKFQEFIYIKITETI